MQEFAGCIADWPVGLYMGKGQLSMSMTQAGYQWPLTSCTHTVVKAAAQLPTSKCMGIPFPSINETASLPHAAPLH